MRRVPGLRPAPQFEEWLRATQIVTDVDSLTLAATVPPGFQAALLRLA